jgi:uncharacterized protein DUF3667
MSITAAPPAERPPAAAPEACAPRTPAAPTTAAASACTDNGAASNTFCDNCGSAVQDRYCGHCGQRFEPPVHSLWHFTTVATEDLTHADSRLWRTLLALLFKPGYLTREFLHGRRASYLPPVRLYLVLSVAFFLWASIAHRPAHVLEIGADDPGAPTAAVKPIAAGTTSVFSPALPGESAEQRATRICGKLVDYQGPLQKQVLPVWRRACPRLVADNGRDLTEAYLHNVPRAMFVFLPLLAGAMMLMYWHPRRYYVEHLLLFLHNHAFVFLLLPLSGMLAVLLPIGGSPVRAATVLYIPWYMFRSMRVVYGQGRALTFAKLVVVSFFYLVSGALMLVLTVVYSVLTL